MMKQKILLELAVRSQEFINSYYRQWMGRGSEVAGSSFHLKFLELQPLPPLPALLPVIMTLATAREGFAEKNIAFSPSVSVEQYTN